jgi:hypothetical protein
VVLVRFGGRCRGLVGQFGIGQLSENEESLVSRLYKNTNILVLAASHGV